MSRWIAIGALFVLAGCGGGGGGGNSAVVGASNTTPPVVAGNCNAPATDAQVMACSLGRGVNLGNALDSPQEGDWGVTLSDTLFDKIKEAGFDSARLTVRWSNHAAATSPYTIDPAFFQRVDFAVDGLLSRGLYVVLDMHHYRQLDGDTLDAGEFPVADAVLEDRMVAMWQQIAERYQGRSAKLAFELYNEPHGRQTAAKWNALAARALTAVRASNPERMVVIGPVQWNSASALSGLSLPADSHLIATIHNYEPFTFTHQGASWATGSSAWLGTVCCSATQLAQMTAPLDVAAQWSSAQNVPVWVGEFGSYEQAPAASREIYTRTMRDEIERRGMRWAYWEFASGFGIYNPTTGQWKDGLRQALLGQ